MNIVVRFRVRVSVGVGRIRMIRVSSRYHAVIALTVTLSSNSDT